jgi:chromosome segregation ATPase
MTDRKTKIEELKKRLGEHTMLVTTLKTQLDTAETEKKELEKKIQALEDEGKKNQEKLDERDKKILEQDKKLKELEEEDKDIDKLLDEALAETDQFKAQIEEINKMGLFTIKK